MSQEQIVGNADIIRDAVLQRIYASPEFQQARMQLYFTCMQFMMKNDDCLTKWLSTFPELAKDKRNEF